MHGTPSTPPTTAPRREALGGLRAALAVAAWLGLLAAGFAALWAYGYTAGASTTGRAPRWPPDTGLAPPGRRPVLLLFVHPECPCSRATLSELARTLARSADAFDARVLIVPADGASGSTHLRRSAEEIPGVLVLEDPEGAEAARFGACTSGTAAVYAAGGARRFFGGLTSARGHEGESAGAGALLALARGADPPVVETPVYGCGLRTPEGADRRGH
jgi:hypothetical protein